MPYGAYQQPCWAAAPSQDRHDWAHVGARECSGSQLVMALTTIREEPERWSVLVVEATTRTGTPLDRSTFAERVMKSAVSPRRAIDCVLLGHRDGVVRIMSISARNRSVGVPTGQRDLVGRFA